MQSLGQREKEGAGQLYRPHSGEGGITQGEPSRGTPRGTCTYQISPPKWLFPIKRNRRARKCCLTGSPVLGQSLWPYSLARSRGWG